MKNVRKIITSMCVVMIVMGLCVVSSYSQDKPSEEEMKDIILRFETSNKILNEKDRYRNIIFKNFDITNSFTSMKNGKYCITVNYIISFDYYASDNGSPMEWITVGRNNYNTRVSFEKKKGKWYGGEGWGPGED